MNPALIAAFVAFLFFISTVIYMYFLVGNSKCDNGTTIAPEDRHVNKMSKNSFYGLIAFVVITTILIFVAGFMDKNTKIPMRGQGQGQGYDQGYDQGYN
jgi:predicted ABC-type sugar transport system permease subunit